LGLPLAIVVGGERRGESSPYPYVWASEDGLRWVDYRETGKTYKCVAGAGIAYYDDKLLMWQGRDSTHLTQSINEGFRWLIPDTAQNKMPETYEYRDFTSVVVDYADKRIFVLGGYNDNGVFSDVWTGKLNRMYWSE
jgi:hypothetical protein